MNFRVFPLCVALGLAPASALADEVTVALNRRTRVPVGPEGTVPVVRRFRIQGRTHVAILTPAAGQQSACGAPVTRVTVWSEMPERGWVESLSDVYSLCGRESGQALNLSVGVFNGPEVRVLVTRPRETSGLLVRYRLVGDRFHSSRREPPIAPSPDEPARATLSPAVDRSLDGDIRAWSGLAPVARGAAGALRAQVWSAVEGRTLRFAARVEGDPSPELRLVLGEPGVSTNQLFGATNNAGRFLTLRCGEASPDVDLRCGADGAAVTFEGSTDLGTMVWSSSSPRAVALLAQVSGAGRQVSSDPAARLRAYAFPSALSFLDGASPETRAACASGYRTFLPVQGAASVLSCGRRCEGGVCDRTMPLDSPRRVAIHRDGSNVCVDVEGFGREAFAACGPRQDRVRLLGTFPLVGFTTVIAVERELASAPQNRTEVWALVSPSAAWQRLWSGAPRPRGPLPRMELGPPNPRFCVDGGCEIARGVTMAPPDAGGPVTNILVRLGYRNARDGLGVF